MAVLTIAQLKTLWVDGFIPDQDDYVDLFDTVESLGGGKDFAQLILENGVANGPITSVDSEGGQSSLNGRYPTVAIATDVQAEHPVIQVRRSRVGGFLQDGDEIGALAFRGLAPYGENVGSGVNSFATENWGASNGGTELRVFTTPNGSNIKRTTAVFHENGGLLMLGKITGGATGIIKDPLTAVSDNSFGISHVNAAGDRKIYTTISSQIGRFYITDAVNAIKVFLSGGGTNYIDAYRLAIGKNTADERLDVNGTVKADTLNLTNVPVFADDAAAATGGLTVGQVYKKPTGELMIKL